MKLYLVIAFVSVFFWGCSNVNEISYDNSSKLALIINKKYSHPKSEKYKHRDVNNCGMLYAHIDADLYPDYIVFELSENKKTFSVLICDSVNQVNKKQIYKDWDFDDSGFLILKFTEVVNDRVYNSFEMTALRIDISNPKHLHIYKVTDMFALVFLIIPYINTLESSGYIVQM